MWFKVIEAHNYDGISKEIYEDCILNRFTNKSELVKGAFWDYYKVSVYFNSISELMEFIDCCEYGVIISKNRTIVIYDKNNML